MHSSNLTILAAQMNPIVGAITKNTDKIKAIIMQHQEQHQVIAFPELALTGYPLEDLLFREDIIKRIQHALLEIQQCISNCHVIVGHPMFTNQHWYNAASIFYNGKLKQQYYKQELPNFGIFDELRYFTPGPKEPCIFTIGHYRIGLCICEDLWHSGQIVQLIERDINILLCINASPYESQKYAQRCHLFNRYINQGIALIYVNMVGGQDELVFDGQSFALNSNGITQARLPAFVEDNASIVITPNGIAKHKLAPVLNLESSIYQALCLSVRDYIEKNNFPGVIVGLSGGVDSALTLAIAADALGSDKVHALIMPSRYNDPMSCEDAIQQTQAMHIQRTIMPIEPAFTTILDMLVASFGALKHDVTEENVQARIRGLLLMALSNKFGKLVLTTSNKSEIAVGYTTLYGDMVGSFCVLKDIYKTQVYALATYRNHSNPIIPTRVLTRPASAELAMHQTDQDSLPPYPILDKIIQLYMEENQDRDTIITHGYTAEIVTQIIKLIQHNEYKRYQAPPGPKITSRAFGKEWRYPLTNHYS